MKPTARAAVAVPILSAFALALCFPARAADAPAPGSTALPRSAPMVLPALPDLKLVNIRMQTRMGVEPWRPLEPLLPGMSVSYLTLPKRFGADGKSLPCPPTARVRFEITVRNDGTGASPALTQKNGVTGLIGGQGYAQAIGAMPPGGSVMIAPFGDGMTLPVAQPLSLQLSVNAINDPKESDATNNAATRQFKIECKYL